MPKRNYIPVSVRNKIYTLSRGCCEYCKCFKKYSPSPFAIEDIKPVASGGSSKFENLAYSCGGCNQHKYAAREALDPASNLIVPLFHPRQDKWLEHFRWSDDLLEIVGITPVGRATILKLKTNRVELINLRKLTIITKEHPPS